MRTLKKPRALSPGDRVAAVTLSWGGPGHVPHRYEAGKRQLKETFGLEVVEMPHTLRSPAWLAENPEARADDLMQAFQDESIAGIVSSIGGEDSIRILPYLDLEVIAANPKVFVGFSDTTVTHLACFKAGLSTFYGPAVLAGFAENGGIFPYLEDSFRRCTFESSAIGVLPANSEGWTVEHVDWEVPENQERLRKLSPCSGWKFLQGSGTVKGHTIGGCLEVLEWLRGTPVWPSPDDWEGAVLFLETSEEAPSPDIVKRALRSYAAEGVLAKLSGILFGRPGGQLPVDQFGAYDEAILAVVAGEQGLRDLPIVTGMDFGHTEPFLTLPYGIALEIDCSSKQLRIPESAVLP